MATRTLQSLKDPAQYATLDGEWQQVEDLQQAVGTMEGTSGSQRDEPGTIANPTQQLVTSQLTGEAVKSDMAGAKGKMSLDDLSSGAGPPRPGRPWTSRPRATTRTSSPRAAAWRCPYPTGQRRGVFFTTLIGVRIMRQKQFVAL